MSKSLTPPDSLSILGRRSFVLVKKKTPKMTLGQCRKLAEIRLAQGFFCFANLHSPLIPGMGFWISHHGIAASQNIVDIVVTHRACKPATTNRAPSVSWTTSNRC
mmetsp:Transcript_6469/g.14124  ORF Transcript_6469/g.14124 Transcript_6469/m.14124 type:complete len:105 (-) Transcript_6469:1030-1344(-)